MFLDSSRVGLPQKSSISGFPRVYSVGSILRLNQKNRKKFCLFLTYDPFMPPQVGIGVLFKIFKILAVFANLSMENTNLRSKMQNLILLFRRFLQKNDY